MSLSIIKKPEKSVNGHLSKWNAVHQPIQFKVQRQDQAVIQKYKFTSPGSTVRIKVNGSIPLTVAVGQRIYYSSPTQKYLLTIVSIVGNIIVTDGLVSGTIYGGFVNYVDAYKNYFVETQIFVRTTSNVYELMGTSRNKVDATGVASINVNEWLRTKAVFEDQFNYDVINKAINGEGGKFSARFRENYNGITTNYGTAEGIAYWSNSAKQVLEIFGTNMGEFVPTYDDTREDRAKFLSVFKRPTFFPGYPFSLSFIYSDNLLNYQIMRKESTKNINGTEIALTSDNLNAAHRFFVNRLMLKESYTSTVKSLQIWLETGSVIPYSPVDLSGTITNGTIFSPLSPTESRFIINNEVL